MGSCLLVCLTLVASINLYYCAESMCDESNLSVRIERSNRTFLCQNCNNHTNISNPVWYRNGIQVNESMVRRSMLPGVEDFSGSSVIFMTSPQPDHESSWSCSRGTNSIMSEERPYYVPVQTSRVTRRFNRQRFINFPSGLSSVGPETRERATFSITITGSGGFFETKQNVNLSSSVHLSFSSPAGSFTFNLSDFTISLQLLASVTEFNWNCTFKIKAPCSMLPTMYYSQIHIRINDTTTQVPETTSTLPASTPSPTPCLPEGDIETVFIVVFLAQNCSSSIAQECDSYELICNSTYNGTLIATSSSHVTVEDVARGLFAGQQVNITLLQSTDISTDDSIQSKNVLLGGGGGGGGLLVVAAIFVIVVIVIVVRKRKHRGSVHVSAAAMAEEGRADGELQATTSFQSEGCGKSHDAVPECGQSHDQSQGNTHQQSDADPVLSNAPAQQSNSQQTISAHQNNGTTCLGAAPLMPPHVPYHVYPPQALLPTNNLHPSQAVIMFSATSQHTPQAFFPAPAALYPQYASGAIFSIPPIQTAPVTSAPLSQQRTADVTLPNLQCHYDASISDPNRLVCRDDDSSMPHSYQQRYHHHQQWQQEPERPREAAVAQAQQDLAS